MGPFHAIYLWSIKLIVVYPRWVDQHDMTGSNERQGSNYCACSVVKRDNRQCSSDGYICRHLEAHYSGSPPWIANLIVVHHENWVVIWIINITRVKGSWDEFGTVIMTQKADRLWESRGNDPIIQSSLRLIVVVVSLMNGIQVILFVWIIRSIKIRFRQKKFTIRERSKLFRFRFGNIGFAFLVVKE